MGASGSGKSDIALRAIITHKAKLICDDRVDFDGAYAHACKNIAGLLEVRGVGIIKLPYIKKQRIHLVVELSKEYERMPHDDYYQDIPKIKINPFEASAIEKIIVATQKKP